MHFPPPLIFIGGLVLAAAFETAAPTPEPPAVVKVLAGVVGVAGAGALVARAASLFLKNSTGIAPWQPSTALVTDGPYRFSRNPMYVGMALLYLGLAFMLSLLWALVLFPVVILVLGRAVIRPEEEYLHATHGRAYEDYRKRVRRWI